MPFYFDMGVSHVSTIDEAVNRVARDLKASPDQIIIKAVQDLKDSDTVFVLPNLDAPQMARDLFRLDAQTRFTEGWTVHDVLSVNRGSPLSALSEQAQRNKINEFHLFQQQGAPGEIAELAPATRVAVISTASKPPRTKLGGKINFIFSKPSS